MNLIGLPVIGDVLLSRLYGQAHAGEGGFTPSHTTRACFLWPSTCPPTCAHIVCPAVNVLYRNHGGGPKTPRLPSRNPFQTACALAQLRVAGSRINSRK